ncbi:hypothetical protein K438DRAFT_1777145 [Mycena galopus ATCC 62051]|nr:hypothetical protein K438DRAFT_1777145 [Mycena galopus ATCC 62051]
MADRFGNRRPPTCGLQNRVVQFLDHPQIAALPPENAEPVSFSRSVSLVYALLILASPSSLGSVFSQNRISGASDPLLGRRTALREEERLGRDPGRPTDSESAFLSDQCVSAAYHHVYVPSPFHTLYPGRQPLLDLWGLLEITTVLRNALAESHVLGVTRQREPPVHSSAYLFGISGFILLLFRGSESSDLTLDLCAIATQLKYGWAFGALVLRKRDGLEHLPSDYIIPQSRIAPPLPSHKAFQLVGAIYSKSSPTLGGLDLTSLKLRFFSDPLMFLQSDCCFCAFTHGTTDLTGVDDVALERGEDYCAMQNKRGEARSVHPTPMHLFFHYPS